MDHYQFLEQVYIYEIRKRLLISDSGETVSMGVWGENFKPDVSIYKFLRSYNIIFRTTNGNKRKRNRKYKPILLSTRPPAISLYLFLVLYNSLSCSLPHFCPDGLGNDNHYREWLQRRVRQCQSAIGGWKPPYSLFGPRWERIVTYCQCFVDPSYMWCVDKYQNFHSYLIYLLMGKNLCRRWLNQL